MSDLHRIELASKNVTRARDELEAAIREAHDNGAALRKIAEAAGLSHETVRRICSAA